MSGRVLVADDEPHNRELLGDLLEAHGYEVSLAVDGAEALAVIELENLDTVLLDIMMPRLDGFEVCRRLRADTRFSALPVILVTALSAREDRLKGIAAGATDYLTKPIDTQEVLLRVRNAVHQKRLYDELRALNDQKNELLGMAAHDLRNPLSVVSSYSRLILADRDGTLPPRLLGPLTAIARQARFMLEMVNDLLDVSRIEAGRLTLDIVPVDFAQLTAEIVSQNSLLAEHKRIELRLESDAMPPIPIDAARIEQVLNNLIGNAVKFSPPGSAVAVRLSRSGDAAVIAVEDHGTGMPPERVATLFQPFSGTSQGTAGEKGTGLGLAIAHKIVDAHGGRIAVESREGVGTTFTVTLPWPDSPPLQPGAMCNLVKEWIRE